MKTKIHVNEKIILLSLFFIVCGFVNAQTLLTNVDSRKVTSLNGTWNYIVDPYENGYYDYRYQVKENGYFKNQKPADKSDLIEYNFDDTNYLTVPGDWNSQAKELFLYEGTVWYKKSFDYNLPKGKRLFLYFGAVNYNAIVSINGKIIGSHTGGFTPFNFEITNDVKPKDNFIIVKVDDKRLADGVPTLNTDWFNYGGITRSVLLLETNGTFIKDYFIQLEKGNQKKISGWIQLDGPEKEQTIELNIPEINFHEKYKTDKNGYVQFSFNAKFELWSPQNPKLYDVSLAMNDEIINDKIGFRTIETKGSEILLNGKPVFLRGISIHEEAPFANGARAYSKEQARTLLGWAKEMNCNYVRLAHYPHNENMLRTADELGLLVWAELPVYWTIQWQNETTYNNAENQLTEVITRDKNRASVVLWSMANETPVSKPRIEFLKKLADKAKKLDPTRLLTAAMEFHKVGGDTLIIEDPFGESVDVLGINEYIGWYDGLPEKCDRIVWKSIYNKPVLISEFGADALFGLHGDELTRWSEEYQNGLYKKTIAMFKKVDFVRGMSPWILKDFRSPRRPLRIIQDFWNRKGLISDKGERKQAFFTLKNFYLDLEKQNQ